MSDEQTRAGQAPARRRGRVPKSEASEVDRRISILEAARKSLIDEGYASLSLRGVATRAGVHLKTLQHYFPAKRDLIFETVHFALERYYMPSYELVFEQLEEATSLEPIELLIRRLIEDVSNEDSTKFFIELWALSLRDEDANMALDQLYARHRQNLARLIAKANTKLPRTVVHLKAALVAAQIEGLVLFLGHGRPPHGELEGLGDAAVDAIMAVIRNR